MIHQNKKSGFTVVELVIVIAVIAIMAAVLIPTFVGLISRANRSADEQAVAQMNKALKISEKLDGKPVNVREAKAVLAESGFRDDGLKPVSANCKFYWISEENVVALIRFASGSEDESAAEVIYPEDAKAKEFFRDHPGKCYDLTTNLPNATVSVRTGDALTCRVPKWPIDLTMTNTEAKDVTLDTGLTLEAPDEGEESLSEEYMNWHVDFEISFNKDINADITDGALNNGEVGFVLLGSFANYNSNEWVPIILQNATADEPIRVMKDLFDNQLPGFEAGYLTYNTISQAVHIFNCGIMAVYDLNDIGNGFNSQNFDNNTQAKDVLNGLVVTLQLKLYETKNGAETGTEHIIRTYTYDFSELAK